MTKYPYRDSVPLDHDLEEFVLKLRAPDLCALSVPVDGADHFFDYVEIEKTDMSVFPDYYMGKAGVLRLRDSMPLLHLYISGGELCLNM